MDFSGTGKLAVAPGITLSKPLAEHWPRLQATALPCIHIDAQPAQSLPPGKSKFGGNVMLPKHIDYPLDRWSDKKMFPLAQINFAEVPPMEGYPSKGWLLIFVEAEGDFGYNPDHPELQEGFRVMFFEEVDENNIHTDTLPDKNMYEDSPVTTQLALTFSLRNDYISIRDIRFEQHMKQSYPAFIAEFNDASGKINEEVLQYFSGSGHKIGGYAAFKLDDPRSEHEQFKDYILLLQIDSIGDHIMWGGYPKDKKAGAGKFFIHPSDLKAKDFSRVVYSWDAADWDKSDY